MKFVNSLQLSAVCQPCCDSLDFRLYCILHLHRVMDERLLHHGGEIMWTRRKLDANLRDLGQPWRGFTVRFHHSSWYFKNIKRKKEQITVGKKKKPETLEEKPVQKKKEKSLMIRSTHFVWNNLNDTFDNWAKAHKKGYGSSVAERYGWVMQAGMTPVNCDLVGQENKHKPHVKKPRGFRSDKRAVWVIKMTSVKRYPLRRKHKPRFYKFQSKNFCSTYNE